MDKTLANGCFDYREMFSVACSFADTATRAAGGQSLSQMGWMRQNIIPEIVNRAFSCEVFLKSLLVYSCTEFKSEHILQKLWNLLPDSLRESIEEEIFKRIELIDDVSFDSLMQNISNAFAEWRYIYEVNAKSINIGFLLVLSDSLREICCILFYRIKWTEYKEMI